MARSKLVHIKIMYIAILSIEDAMTVERLLNSLVSYFIHSTFTCKIPNNYNLENNTDATL